MEICVDDTLKAIADGNTRKGEKGRGKSGKGKTKGERGGGKGGNWRTENGTKTETEDNC